MCAFVLNVLITLSPKHYDSNSISPTEIECNFHMQEFLFLPQYNKGSCFIAFHKVFHKHKYKIVKGDFFESFD